MKKNTVKIMTEFPDSSYPDWLFSAEKSLKGKKVTDIRYHTADDIIVEPLYTLDRNTLPEYISKSLPGNFPFLRGNDDFKTTKLPLICQEITNSESSNYNKQLKANLQTGQNSIFLRLKTKNDKSVLGTVVNEIEDLDKMFDGINLKKYPLYISYTASSIYLLPATIDKLFHLGLDKNSVVLISYDTFDELLMNGSERYESFELCSWLMENYPKSEYTNFRQLYIDGSKFSNSGSSSLQEIAFSFAQALEIIYHLLDKGFDIDEISSSIHFSISINSNFFEEISKFRAMRVVWANLMEQLGASEDNQKINVRAVSSLTNKSSLDEETNILRSTTEVLSALIAGCDAITSLQHSYFTAPDSVNSNRITKNIQNILHNECNLQYAADPSGGSWFIETLTHQTAEKIWKSLSDIDSNGGFVNSLKKGIIQNQITETRKNQQEKISLRKTTMIGVNKYPNSKEKTNKKIKDTFQTVNEQVFETNNTLPLPNGRIQIQPLTSFRPDRKFLELRDNSIKFKEKTKSFPQVFIGALGNLSTHKARVDFTRELLSVGLIECKYNENGYLDFESLAADYTASKLEVIVLCSSDEIYKEEGPDTIRMIRSSKPDSFIIIAGNPEKLKQYFSETEADMYIHIKSNIIDVLSVIQEKSGMEMNYEEN